MSQAVRGRRRAFSLPEVLVVVAIILLLLAILLPSLDSAREQARTATCAAHLHQLGIAALAYQDDSGGWIAGSPNTSGNGARPGFAAGDYTDTASPDHYPALHVFDWGNPLLPYVGVRPPREFPKRYAAAVGRVMRCPSNRRRAGPVQVEPLKRLIPFDAWPPSYATSRYFMYVGKQADTGDVAGTLWWEAACVPPYYVPRIDRLDRPPDKAYLADAYVVSKTKGEIANANWGFSSHGAWRWYDEAPVTYRGAFLREQMWRHDGAIQILAFDGHVVRQRELDGRSRGGCGDGARRVTWWFPSGTRTALLPSRAREPALVVP